MDLARWFGRRAKYMAAAKQAAARRAWAMRGGGKQAQGSGRIGSAA